MKHFLKALTEAMLEYGEDRRPFGAQGPLVKVTPADRVRNEFMLSYPADGGDAEQKANTKRTAYRRTLTAAMAAGVICCREFGGRDYIWAIEQDGTGHPQHGTGQDTP